MKRVLFTLCVLLSTTTIYAQTIRIADGREFLFSDFYVAIVAGVLLALIFQIVLTALSVAMGITMIGNVKKKFAESQAKLESERGSNEFIYDKDCDHDDITGVKFSSAFGIWSLITTTLSLFGACALALNLSFFGTLASNLTIALVIWALFYMILFYLESKIVHTLIGGLITTATAGLKFSAGIVKDLFKNVPTAKSNDTIENTLDKIRKDNAFNLHNDRISKVLNGFLEKSDVNSTQNDMLNFKDLKNDLNKIIDNPKESISTMKARIQKLDKEAIIDLVENSKFINEKEVSNISSNINSIIGELKIRIDKIEQKVNEEVKLTKRKAIIQAENARKTAASAAWWLVLTVVFSGVSAMFGAYLELME
ncbi:hypothetical protein [Brumimicrobium mesophilum]|uniref:hypothetical protein n=1 Tax=Brumimicrobium mesophilum TaxID=392717 RepID=UPI000D144D7A|nr:hypothetical protein [Brumimicrobium mesophilum]